MRFKPLQAAAGLFVAGVLACPTSAQGVDPLLEKSSMYGIGQGGGKLWRYDFPTSQANLVQHVRFVDGGGTPTGIEASAYFPGFQQIHAFWQDPTDNLSKVVHIDTETGEAALSGIDLGKGKVRGAVAVVSDGYVTLSDGTQKAAKQYRVFGLQDKVQPPTPHAVRGQLNINPTNGNQAEFELTKAAGGKITRDDLKTQNYTLQPDGTVFQGLASKIIVKPKGNGNQNGLILNGEAYHYANSTTITIESSNMTVRLFNDHIHNDKAMGHWWIEASAETATVTVDSTVVVSPPAPWVPTSRVFTLHTKTGLATTAMELSHYYDGDLATQDGQTFYATRGNELWRIVPESKSETLIATLSVNNVQGLEFVGNSLMAFETNGNKLIPINPQTGQPQGSGATLDGITGLGSITFLPTTEIPNKIKVAFD